MRIKALKAAVAALSVSIPSARADDAIQRVIRHEIFSLLPRGEAGGITVATIVDGHTSFFGHGLADIGIGKPVNQDSLFNIASLRKPFETTVLADAVLHGRMGLDDPVTKYLPELAAGRDIARVTVRQLATHTSGLLLPQDHPPWPTEHYSLRAFIDTLNDWHADPPYEPGRRHMYTHAGYILLQLVLERALQRPISSLITEHVLEPLGMGSTLLPLRQNSRQADLPPEPLARTVQGYGEDGAAEGAPGDQQTYYDWPGTGQMFSSARDLARFVDANIGGGQVPDGLARAMAMTRAPAFTIGPHNAQALAWEVETTAGAAIIEKNGGLNNASAYMALMPSAKTGIVILSNRGGKDVATAGRRALRMLSQRSF